MKRFVLAIALTGLLSMPVLAGDIPINGAPAPAPPPATTLSTTSTSSSTLLVTVILTVLGLR
jgi:hypothetical protein